METIRINESTLKNLICEAILKEIGPKAAAYHKLSLNKLDNLPIPQFNRRGENSKTRASRAQSMDAEVLHKAFQDTVGSIKIYFDYFFDHILQFKFVFHVSSLANITDKDVLLIGVKFSKDQSPEALQIKYNFREEDVKKKFTLYHQKTRVTIVPADNDLEERSPYNIDKPLNNPVAIQKLDKFIQDYLSVNPHGNARI